jgi:hypothetical protein
MENDRIRLTDGNQIGDKGKARVELQEGRIVIVGGTGKQRKSKWRQILHNSGITQERYDEMNRKKYPL